MISFLLGVIVYFITYTCIFFLCFISILFFFLNLKRMQQKNMSAPQSTQDPKKREEGTKGKQKIHVSGIRKKNSAARKNTTSFPRFTNGIQKKRLHQAKGNAITVQKESKNINKIPTFSLENMIASKNDGKILDENESTYSDEDDGRYYNDIHDHKIMRIHMRPSLSNPNFWIIAGFVHIFSYILVFFFFGYKTHVYPSFALCIVSMFISHFFTVYVESHYIYASYIHSVHMISGWMFLSFYDILGISIKNYYISQGIGIFHIFLTVFYYFKPRKSIYIIQYLSVLVIPLEYPFDIGINNTIRHLMLFYILWDIEIIVGSIILKDKNISHVYMFMLQVPILRLPPNGWIAYFYVSCMIGIRMYHMRDYIICDKNSCVIKRNVVNSPSLSIDNQNGGKQKKRKFKYDFDYTLNTFDANSAISKVAKKSPFESQYSLSPPSSLSSFPHRGSETEENKDDNGALVGHVENEQQTKTPSVIIDFHEKTVENSPSSETYSLVEENRGPICNIQQQKEEEEGEPYMFNIQRLGSQNTSISLFSSLYMEPKKEEEEQQQQQQEAIYPYAPQISYEKEMKESFSIAPKKESIVNRIKNSKMIDF